VKFQGAEFLINILFFLEKFREISPEKIGKLNGHFFLPNLEE
jgi:hypothetical protein